MFKKIIQIHIIENKSPKELAELLGPPLTEKTVYEYIKRALNKVRLAVEKVYTEKEG